MHSLPFVRLLKQGRDLTQSLDFQKLVIWLSSRAPAMRLDVCLDVSRLSFFAWHRPPHSHWPQMVTSSLAYSGFRKAMPHFPATGQALLALPLWNLIFLDKQLRLDLPCSENPHGSDQLAQRHEQVLRILIAHQSKDERFNGEPKMCTT